MNSDSAPIFFEFRGEREAHLAMDTLQELGYRPGFLNNAGKPTLHVHVDNQDLASALEIAQSFGGILTELSGEDEKRLYDAAYAMEGLSIPAHLVNEDWPEGYAEAKGYAEPEARPDRLMASYAIQMNSVPVDPERPNTLAGDEDLNGFDAGVHL
jgi:hypothetical protein